MRHLALTIAAAVALTGCGPVKPNIPETVYVTVEKIVPVPESLTRPCDEVARRDSTVGEAVRLANARLASLQQCNADKAEIRGLTE